MSEITRLLQQADGNSAHLDAVFEQLYPELRRLASARLQALRTGQTLTPTVLVNEAYMKMIQSSDRLDLKSRRHFFACAARAMRHIVIDSLRAATAGKRGGTSQDVTLHDNISLPDNTLQLLDLDRALQDLGQLDARQRELVEMRFFAGLPITEIAELMEVSERTAWREWKRARAFLHAHLAGEVGEGRA